VKYKKFATIFVLLAVLAPLFTHAEKIGWIADIHAGSAKKKKKSTTNVFYPRYYKKYLAQTLEEMQREGIGLVVISGDVTDKSRQTKYAKRIRSMIQRKGMEMIWARGNHDREKAVEKYMKQKHSYFFLDRYGWRIIALDNSQRLSIKEGGMRSVQKEWLEELLSETKEPVLAVMHYPFFDRRDGSVYRVYRETENWFSSEGKVKLALSGHWHSEYITVLNGVKYAVGNPLTLESKMGSYYVVDLDNLWVDARQAQIPVVLKKKTRSDKI